MYLGTRNICNRRMRRTRSFLVFGFWLSKVPMTDLGTERMRHIQYGGRSDASQQHEATADARRRSEARRRPFSTLAGQIPAVLPLGLRQPQNGSPGRQAI